jgi:hypothetical protein
MSWRLQQINNTNGSGPTMPGEPIACPQATAEGEEETPNLSISAFGDQLHFSYIDGNGNIQDCWYDGPTNSWNLQQINNANGLGPTVPGEPVACPQATATTQVIGPQLCVSTFGTSSTSPTSTFTVAKENENVLALAADQQR